MLVLPKSAVGCRLRVARSSARVENSVNVFSSIPQPLSMTVKNPCSFSSLKKQPMLTRRPASAVFPSHAWIELSISSARASWIDGKCERLASVNAL
jgi:hypothetical protein